MDWRRLDRALQRPYDRLCDATERALARWWGGAAYGLSCWALWQFRGGGAEDAWVSDVSGPFLLVALLALGRRGARATHAKLDCLTADARLDRAEELSEDEIEEMRR